MIGLLRACCYGIDSGGWESLMFRSSFNCPPGVHFILYDVYHCSLVWDHRLSMPHPVFGINTHLYSAVVAGLSWPRFIFGNQHGKSHLVEDVGNSCSCSLLALRLAMRSSSPFRWLRYWGWGGVYCHLLVYPRQFLKGMPAATEMRSICYFSV